MTMSASLFRRSSAQVASVRGLTRAASSVAAPARRDASGLEGRVAVVLGSQWGDEGKGKLSDMLAEKYDIVARFNGGNNAGHTIIANGHKFAFHLLPSGLVYPHTLNLIGNGVVVDVDSLFSELEPLGAKGIKTDGRIKVSDRAHLVFDFHKSLDAIQEKRRGGNSLGTTKKGIGPAYMAKAQRDSIRVGELRFWDDFEPRFRELSASYMHQYGDEGMTIDVEGDLAKLKKQRDMLMADDMIVDSVQFINQQYRDGARILTEGANAAMLDIDYGTFPYVTSSTTTAGGIATGLGLAPDRLDAVLGVVKAYTTRVGAGPFPTELTDDLSGGDRERGSYETEIGAHMQTVGFEIGVTTGRKRRCGWLDAVVLRYSHMVNNYSGLNLTKLDVLNDLAEIKIGVAYEIDGKRLLDGAMPSTLRELKQVKVVYESMPGWQSDISKCKTMEELPVNARNYIARVEQLVDAPVSWIGVGPHRDEMIYNSMQTV